MRRQRRTHHHSEEDDYQPSNSSLQNGTDDFLQLEPLVRSARSHKQPEYRFENTMEAKVQDGDTLQALALRFHCSLADIKRLNKIDKDNEIYARKVVKIPVTVHSVLLGALPQVHTSGNNSPRLSPKSCNDAELSHIMRNPLEDARVMLNEKLIIASVNSGGADAAGGSSNSNKSNGEREHINNFILNSKLIGNTTIYTDDDDAQSHTFSRTADSHEISSPLLDDVLDDETLPRLRPIRGPSLRTIDWSGADCDMSWVCLFIVILGVCVLIPLIYVVYLLEQREASHHNTSKISFNST